MLKKSKKQYSKRKGDTMIIGLDAGHTLSGAGTGASSKYASETVKNREILNKLTAILREKGHTVVNCTIDKSSNDLADRVAIANAQNLDLFVSLHLNAYKLTEEAMGVETYIYNGSYSGKEANRTIAKRVNDKLVKNIGWKNRGVKEANYYVLKNTKAPAILVELGFCDSKADMDLWDTTKIAKALFESITNTAYTPTTTSSSTTTSGDTYYRVIVGSYKNRDNAVAQQNKLKSAGFDSFLEALKK